MCGERPVFGAVVQRVGDRPGRTGTGGIAPGGAFKGYSVGVGGRNPPTPPTPPEAPDPRKPRPDSEKGWEMGEERPERASGPETADLLRPD